MTVTIAELVVWLIIGLLAGSLAGLVIKRKKAGFGHLNNLAVGLAGALIGGFLFNWIGIDLGLSEITVSLQDIVSAFVGSLLFLLALYFGKRWFREREGKTERATDQE